MLSPAVAPPAWDPCEGNLTSVLPGRCRPVATIWGAQGLRVRLKDGLYAPRRNRPLCRGRRARLPSASPPFHPLRVGNAGGGLKRNWPAGWRRLAVVVIASAAK